MWDNPRKNERLWSAKLFKNNRKVEEDGMKNLYKKIYSAFWFIFSPIVVSFSIVGYALCNLFGYDPIKTPVPVEYYDHDYEDECNWFIDITIIIVLLVILVIATPVVVMGWIINPTKKTFSKLFNFPAWM